MSLVPLLARGAPVLPCQIIVDYAYLNRCPSGIDIFVKTPFRTEDRGDHVIITPTRSEGRPLPPYCRNPYYQTDVRDLVRGGLVSKDDVRKVLDIDIDLDLGGLLDTVGDLVGGLLGGRDEDNVSDEAAESFEAFTRSEDAAAAALAPRCNAPGGGCTGTRRYRPFCGKKLRRRQGTRCSAPTYNACLQRCEADAITASIRLGGLNVCLGVELSRGIEVDGCVVYTGRPQKNILDLEVDALVDDTTSDVFWFLQ